MLLYICSIILWNVFFCDFIKKVDPTRFHRLFGGLKRNRVNSDFDINDVFQAYFYWTIMKGKPLQGLEL